MKKLMLTLGLLSVLGLSACGPKLTVDKESYTPTGLVAVVKGSANGHDKVQYKAPSGNGTATVKNGQYGINVPASTQAQTVTVKAGDQSAKTTVKAVKPLASYASFSKNYNNGIVISALSKEQQAKLKQGASALVGDNDLQKALANAITTTKAQQMPDEVKDGVQQLMKTPSGTVRANVQDGQVLGVSAIVPLKVFSDDKLQVQFGTQFGLIVNAVGGDPVKVGTALQKIAKKKNGDKTAIDPIKTNGVTINADGSTKALYFYITK